MYHLVKQPIELMFGVYRRRLLAILLLRPDEKFHVRELSRMTGISPGSIHRELKAMSQSGLLVREHVGNQVLYQADVGCPIYQELAAIFRKTIGLTTILQDALSDLRGKIDLALVFGSMASGSQSSSSDVDVLVLGDLPLVDVVKALSTVQSDLGREINPVVMPTDRFIAKLHNQDRFAKRLLEEPKLFVIGDKNEFGKLATNRAAR